MGAKSIATKGVAGIAGVLGAVRFWNRDGAIDDIIGINGDFSDLSTNLRFPLDDISAGDYWTQFEFNAWVPHKVDEETAAKRQTNDVAKDYLGHLWLPMPLQLSTAYNQNYSETDNMMTERGSGINGAIDNLTHQIAQEAAVKGLSTILPNNSAKMGLGSILNNHMGMVYEGPTLRGHTFSWRMTPKNREEQKAIENIVKYFKTISAPFTFGNKNTAADANTKAQPDPDDENISEADIEEANSVQNVLRKISRLGIPATCTVTFTQEGFNNPHLFKVKDSFITGVDVNYTPQGTWQSYEDGAPIETQLTITLKEASALTYDDVGAGGY